MICNMENFNGMIVCENTGDMEVWHSGTLHIYGEEGTASISIDSTLSINIKFKTESHVPAGRINFNGNGMAMTITCYNFFSALREGPTHPIKIGTYDSHDLYIGLSISTYGENFRLVNYCLLRK